MASTDQPGSASADGPAERPSGGGGSAGGARRNRSRRGPRSGSGVGTPSGEAQPGGGASGGTRSRGGRTPNGQASNGQASNGQASGAKSSGGRSSGGRSSGGRSAARQPAGKQPSAGPNGGGGQPSRGRSSESSGRSRGGSGGGPRGGARPAKPQTPAPAPPDASPIDAGAGVAGLLAGAAVPEAVERANGRRAQGLAAGAAAVPAVVVGVVLGVTLGVVAGAVAAVVVAALVFWAVLAAATGAVLRMIGARPVREDEYPRLANVVEGLCATFGLRPPEVWVVADPVPNACSLGRSASAGVLVVTTGLVDRLGLIETEGVVAHELAHIKRHDTQVAAVAVLVVGPLAWVFGHDDWLHTAVGRGREFAADELATAAVRYPPGLHDALCAITHGASATAGTRFTGRTLAMTRWIWVDPWVGRGPGASLEGELDATPVRIAALAER